jgi:hypothetical protein
MKVLVLSRSALNSDDNMGNTMENLFGNSDKIELHSLYMRAGSYNNNICKTVYQISEQRLIKSIFNRCDCGEEVETTIVENSDETKERRVYDFAKRVNFYILWFIRELIWAFGCWKTQNLRDYLQKIQPDIIFMPSFNCWYPYKILKYIKQQTNARIVLYHADDNYSLKQLHVSPFYWLYRFNLRRWIRRSVENSRLNFCISNLQVSEYEKQFGVRCDLLQKAGNFEESAKIERDVNKPIKMVYTGNLSSGRWSTLALIVEALKLINYESTKAQLYIYTGTTLTSKIKEALSTDGFVFYMGRVPAKDISNIQSSADILVHAESFRLKDKLEVRLSFSTKIVDYLSRGRCILAVGPYSVASIQYFIQNKSGYVITDKKTLGKNLAQLIDDNNQIMSTAVAAWECGKKNHDEKFMRERFIERLNSICSVNLE